MLLRVFAIATTLLIVSPAADVSAAGGPASTAGVSAPDNATPDTTPTSDTFNVYFPEERSLSDCLSSLPKPGCGSDARGGWCQFLVLVVILGGHAFIGWRIVAGSRKGRSRKAVP